MRQQRIIDGCGVLVGCLDEPLPGVSGKQYELVEEVVESVDVEFGVGDVVEVVDPDGEGTVCWEVKQFIASYVMVLCEFESVTPGGFDPDPVTVDTAVEKVVAVHEKPPRSNEQK